MNKRNILVLTLAGFAFIFSGCGALKQQLAQAAAEENAGTLLDKGMPVAAEAVEAMLKERSGMWTKAEKTGSGPFSDGVTVTGRTDKNRWEMVLYTPRKGGSGMIPDSGHALLNKFTKQEKIDGEWKDVSKDLYDSELERIQNYVKRYKK